jgi:hypothetical protein
MTCMPKPKDISKSYKKRYEQYMTALSKLKAVQDDNPCLA